MVAQAVKRYAPRRVVGVLRRVVRGTEAEVGERLRATQATQGGATAVINTAYIERLQATFPLPACLAGAQNARDGATEGDARGGHVVGRDGLQLLPGASLSKVGREQGRRAAMDRANSCSSRRAHRSPLDGIRTVELRRSSSYRAQAVRQTTEMVVGGRSCGLTTLHG